MSTSVAILNNLNRSSGACFIRLKRLLNAIQTMPLKWFSSGGLKFATDAQIRLRCLTKIVPFVFLLANTSAEGQTTLVPAPKDAPSFQEQKAEWDRIGREAEKYGLSYREKKAEWAAEWERIGREAEKQGPSFREQKAEWDRVSREAEKHGLSYREQKAEWAKSNSGMKSVLKNSADREADGDRPSNRNEATLPKE